MQPVLLLLHPQHAPQLPVPAHVHAVLGAQLLEAHKVAHPRVRLVPREPHNLVPAAVIGCGFGGFREQRPKPCAMLHTPYARSTKEVSEKRAKTADSSAAPRKTRLRNSKQRSEGTQTGMNEEKPHPTRTHSPPLPVCGEHPALRLGPKRALPEDEL